MPRGVGSEVGGRREGRDAAVKATDTCRLGRRPLVVGRLPRYPQCDVEGRRRGTVQIDWVEHPLGHMYVCESFPDTRRPHPLGDAVEPSAAYGVRSGRRLCQTARGNSTDWHDQNRRMESHPDKCVERLPPSQEILASEGTRSRTNPDVAFWLGEMRRTGRRSAACCGAHPNRSAGVWGEAFVASGGDPLQAVLDVNCPGTIGHGPTEEG